MKKHTIYLLTFLLSFLTMFGTVQAEANILDEAKSNVKTYYYGSINGNIDEATSLEQLMNMLDVHSNYYTEEEAIELLNSIEQTTVGIGIMVEQHPDGIIIMNVIEGGSAYNNGIKSGEIITHVDGISIKGYGVDMATSLIKGEEGTSVTLRIIRPDFTTYEVTLKRTAFSVPAVTSQLLYGNVGYISLSTFSENAAIQVKNAAVKLQELGATSFIFDLQNNTGGIVSTAQQVIGLFPNTKIAYIQHTKYFSQEIEPFDLNFKFPSHTRLLINRYSASASEMTAAALKDQKVATLYGERSYGKGTVQGFYALSNGGLLKLTQAEFRGPSNEIINNRGVLPDIETSTPLETAHFDQIKSNYNRYRPLKSFSNVPVDKVFEITFSKQVASTIDSNAIELVELGGNTVPVTLELNGTKLKVTPNHTLSYGKQYLLIVHPSLKSKQDKQLKYGYYSHITVTK